jgi:hypothetical protein
MLIGFSPTDRTGAGLLMSAGGSKLRWCSYFKLFMFIKLILINKHLYRPRPYGSNNCTSSRSFIFTTQLNLCVCFRLVSGLVSRGDVRSTRNSNSWQENPLHMIFSSCWFTRRRHSVTILRRSIPSEHIMCVYFFPSSFFPWSLILFFFIQSGPVGFVHWFDWHIYWIWFLCRIILLKLTWLWMRARLYGKLMISAKNCKTR